MKNTDSREKDLNFSGNYGNCVSCNRNTPMKDKEDNHLCSKECFDRFHKKKKIIRF